MSKRNYVFVVEERTKAGYRPVCADVSEKIANRMLGGLREFDLSNNEDRYRVTKYVSTEEPSC